MQALLPVSKNTTQDKLAKDNTQKGKFVKLI